MTVTDPKEHKRLLFPEHLRVELAVYVLEARVKAAFAQIKPYIGRARCKQCHRPIYWIPPELHGDIDYPNGIWRHEGTHSRFCDLADSEW